ncbi:MAG: hypothetical protein LBI28_14565 [Treponema sp.]|jgi:hypothetical protein|nr:hypothetical protein [Treponema sp.]
MLVVSQEQMERPSRGSIPEELLRPGRGGESARYPIDTVIGELGRGTASASAFTFAGSIASGLLSGLMEHPALSPINSVLRESYLSALEVINPVSYRLGGGREEADGAVSFLVRFIGREQGITGEIYVRYMTRRTGGGEEEVTTTGSWAFEDLLLEEAKDREVEQKEAASRYDFYPYERFY